MRKNLIGPHSAGVVALIHPDRYPVASRRSSRTPSDTRHARSESVKKIVTIGLATTMLLALSGASPAQAHDRLVPTSLTIKVSDRSVDRGDKVTFRGKLRSDWKKCRANSKVKLVRNQQVVATKTTKPNGSYAFRRNITSTANWRVRFPGKKVNVVHPHNHRCLSSQSRSVRVRAS
jgi:hypothetical protein